MPAHKRYRSQSPDTATDVGPKQAARSWIDRTSSSKLLYAGEGQTVEVYLFSQGRLVGNLGGFQRADGLCTDEAGDVFVTDEFAGTITEYAHGGTEPLRSFADLGAAPYGCAVDPNSGDLAVSNTGDTAMSDIVVYRKHHFNAPIVYSDPSVYSF